MNPNPDPHCQDRLLDAVLGDDEWQNADGACKARALCALRAHQHRRRTLRRAGVAAGLAALMGFAAFWFNHSGLGVRAGSQKVAAPPAASRPSGFLSDDELLASFPEGSCCLFEVDGRKELVFLNPNVERQYVARP